RPRPIALRPYSPNETLAPRVATPVLRPFCCLRYLVRAGCSTRYSLSSSASAAGAAGAPDSSPSLTIFLTRLMTALGLSAAAASGLFGRGGAALRSPSGLAGPRRAPALRARRVPLRAAARPLSPRGAPLCAARPVLRAPP